MRRKEGLHHVRDEGGGVLGSVPGSEGADFLGRAINSFLQPPVKECGSEQARQGCKRAGGRKPFSRYLSHFHLFPPSLLLAVKLLIGCSVPTTRCLICKRVSVKLQVHINEYYKTSKNMELRSYRKLPLMALSCIGL